MLRKMKSSVRFKLLTTVFLITLIPLMLAGYFNFKISSEAVYDMAVQDLAYITELKARELNHVLDMENGGEKSKSALENIVEDVHQRFYQPAGLAGYGYLVDEQGVAVYHPAADMLGHDFTQEEIGVHMLNTKQGYSEHSWQEERWVTSYGELNNGWIFAITLPVNDLSSSLDQVEMIMIGLCLLFSLIAILIGFFLISQVLRPMKKLVSAMKNAEQGDLRVEVDVQTSDEIGQLSTIFNEMLASFRTIVSKMQRVSEQVVASSQELTASAETSSRASEQITSAVAEIVSAADGQASSCVESTETIQEMNRKIEGIVQQAEQMRFTSQEGTRYAQNGEVILTKVMTEMQEITQKSQEAQGIIDYLGMESQAIRGIISTIVEISEQTNLLALNAAIEAARAGEQGKSFAVVAEEIRKLALQSGNAAEEITLLIERIYAEIQKAIKAMGENIAAVQDGEKVVDEATDSFQHIIKAIEEMSVQISGVNQAVVEIGDEAQLVVKHAEQISSLAQEVASDTEEVAAASEEQTASMQEINSSAEMLSHMAAELQEEVKQFKI